jgi:hypothetical protein
MGEYWIYWNYMSFPYLDAVRRANPNTAVMAPDVLRYMTNAYFKMRQDIHRLGFKVGLYKLLIQLTRSLKPPGDPTLEPMIL